MSIIKKFESFSDNEIEDLFNNIEDLLLFGSTFDFSDFKNTSFDLLRKEVLYKGSYLVNNNNFFFFYNCYPNSSILDNPYLSTIIPCLRFDVKFKLKDIDTLDRKETPPKDFLLNVFNRVIKYDKGISIYVRTRSVYYGEYIFEVIILKVNISESISGWELIGQHMGPNYPEQKTAVTLNNTDTDVLMGDDGNFYTWYDYQDLYNQYLKNNGDTSIGSEFNKNNLDSILIFLNSI